VFKKSLYRPLNLNANFPSMLLKVAFMKKTAFFLAFSFISLLSLAQVQRVVTPKPADSLSRLNGSPDEKNNRGNRKQMMRELNLTREQRGKIKEIRQSNMAKRDEINNNDSLTPAQKEAKLRELKRSQAQSTMSILSDEQKAKAKAIRQGRGKDQQNQNN
jgi:Spy/CpxP family protein refolding chaperone